MKCIFQSDSPPPGGGDGRVGAIQKTRERKTPHKKTQTSVQ